MELFLPTLGVAVFVCYVFWDRRVGIVRNVPLMIFVGLLSAVVLELQDMRHAYNATQEETGLFINEVCGDPYVLERHGTLQTMCRDMKHKKERTFGKVVNDRLLEIMEYLSDNPLMHTASPDYLQVAFLIALMAFGWNYRIAWVEDQRDKRQHHTQRHRIESESLHLQGIADLAREAVGLKTKPELTDGKLDPTNFVQ